jgi:hypothetical protein
VLGYQPASFDAVRKWNGSGWTLPVQYLDAVDAYPDPAGWYSYDSTPVSEPVLDVGEGVSICGSKRVWARDYGFCQGNIGNNDTPFITAMTSTAYGSDHFDGWVGMLFEVGNSSITVSALGRWVISGNNGTHAVKITQFGGNDVNGASVSINTAGAAEGFKYVDLSSPVTLQANTWYYIWSRETPSGDAFYPCAGISHTSVATVPYSVSFDTSIHNNDGCGSDHCHGAVNFKYSTP